MVMSFIVGMLLVLAMVIQKAMHRIHWIKGSLTMVMTGLITQLMLDMGELFSNPTTEKITDLSTFIFNLVDYVWFHFEMCRCCDRI